MLNAWGLLEQEATEKTESEMLGRQQISETSVDSCFITSSSNGTRSTMKLTASGGTDGANIVLFWPDNLPENADQLLADDPIALVEDLQTEGKLIWFPCEGDGSYSVAIYLQEEIPEPLRQFCQHEEEYQQLAVRGEGYFGGLEYMFKHDRQFLDQHQGMCQPVKMPAGQYSASVYQTEIPQAFAASWLREQSGAAAMRISNLQGWLVSLSVLGVFASLISLFILPRPAWFALASVTAILIGGCALLSKSEAYQTVAKAREEYERTFPTYVVRIE